MFRPKIFGEYSKQLQGDYQNVVVSQKESNFKQTDLDFFNKKSAKKPPLPPSQNTTAMS